MSNDHKDGLQAKIDALMLEYCPDEITPEQIENWKRHQVSAGPEYETLHDGEDDPKWGEQLTDIGAMPRIKP